MRHNKRHRRRFELTDHFCDKYRARYGRDPLTHEIEMIVNRAALAQRSMSMRYCDSGKPWNALGIYIDFRERIAVLVDGTGPVDRAVTLLTEADQQ